MKKLLLLAGATALLSASPTLAKPKAGKAHGAAKPAKIEMGPSSARSQLDLNRNGVADWRERRMIDANANGIADWRERRRVDINRNGIADWRERRIDRDRDGVDDREEAMMRRYGGAVCPPGLAKKTPACIPPGQAKRMFSEGQRLPNGFRYYTPFGDIPNDLRTRYDLDDDFRYIYRDNRIYVVDPTTSLITRIIDAVL